VIDQNSLSKSSRTSFYDYHQNTLKRHFSEFENVTSQKQNLK